MIDRSCNQNGMPSSLCNRRKDNRRERSRILHNVFKLPIPILENSVANITANSSYGRYINLSLLIIIDEVSMRPLQVLKIIDYCGIYAMKMINVNHLEEKQHFCDFWQMLPVSPHESRGTCVTSWHEFPYFHKITLT